MLHIAHVTGYLMLHFAHCHGVGIIPGQQSDHKVNEVAPRQIHAQWAVRRSAMSQGVSDFRPAGLFTHREGPGDQRPSDRKLDDKREHKLLHKYSRGTQREACIIHSSLSTWCVCFLRTHVKRGELVFIWRLLYTCQGIILLASDVCISFSACAGPDCLGWLQWVTHTHERLRDSQSPGGSLTVKVSLTKREKML